MDEEYHHWCTVKVWRVADGALLFERAMEGAWSRLEFRAGGLYGLDGQRADYVGLSGA